MRGKKMKKEIRVSVYNDFNEPIARVRYNANLDKYHDGAWYNGGIGYHKGLTSLSDGRFVLISHSDWHNDNPKAKIVTDEEALEAIKESDRYELLEKNQFEKLKQLHETTSPSEVSHMLMSYESTARYLELLEDSKVKEPSSEYQALFYIMATVTDLYHKRQHIFDFKDGGIEIGCLDSEYVDFCSSSKDLIKLGFNLFNGYSEDKHMTPLHLLSNLDFKNFDIAMQAIKIRFGHS